jgi:hypothetical protein
MKYVIPVWAITLSSIALFIGTPQAALIITTLGLVWTLDIPVNDVKA